jgi:hypothetical protein
MKKMITLFAVLGMVFALAPAAQAAPVTDPALFTPVPTGPYRIVFATSSHPMADASRDMDDFDADVTAAANAVPALVALGTTWKCLGSTPTVDARDNTSTAGTGDANDVPIYTTTGLLVADDNADLWDGTIQNAIWLDDGTTPGTGTGYENYQWTGSNADGTGATSGDGRQMSFDGSIRVSRGGKIDSSWISGVSIGSADTRGARLYGISGVIQGIPEPSSLSLLALGGLALLRRRRA